MNDKSVQFERPSSPTDLEYTTYTSFGLQFVQMGTFCYRCAYGLSSVYRWSYGSCWSCRSFTQSQESRVKKIRKLSSLQGHHLLFGLPQPHNALLAECRGVSRSVICAKLESISETIFGSSQLQYYIRTVYPFLKAPIHFQIGLAASVSW